MSAQNFKGYLIRFPKTGQQFPHELMNKDSYKSTPLQRTDLKAYRDNNIDLHRVVSPNYKSKIEFQTIDSLSLAQLEQIQNCLNAAIINRKERKLVVEYWDEELMNYRTMTVYKPDITYTVSAVHRAENDVIYKAFTIKFIEY